eukprot:scaffold51766_cov53-Attheya_sp.AAC.4
MSPGPTTLSNKSSKSSSSGDTSNKASKSTSSGGSRSAASPTVSPAVPRYAAAAGARKGQRAENRKNKKRSSTRKRMQDIPEEP